MVGDNTSATTYFGPESDKVCVFSSVKDVRKLKQFEASKEYCEIRKSLRNLKRQPYMFHSSEGQLYASRKGSSMRLDVRRGITVFEEILKR